MYIGRTQILGDTGIFVVDTRNSEALVTANNPTPTTQILYYQAWDVDFISCTVERYIANIPYGATITVGGSSSTYCFFFANAEMKITNPLLHGDSIRYSTLSNVHDSLDEFLTLTRGYSVTTGGSDDIVAVAVVAGYDTHVNGLTMESQATPPGPYYNASKGGSAVIVASSG